MSKLSKVKYIEFEDKIQNVLFEPFDIIDRLKENKIVWNKMNTPLRLKVDVAALAAEGVSVIEKPLSYTYILEYGFEFQDPPVI